MRGGRVEPSSPRPSTGMGGGEPARRAPPRHALHRGGGGESQAAAGQWAHPPHPRQPLGSGILVLGTYFTAYPLQLDRYFEQEAFE